jgi:small subunit ribosomal protein S10
VEEQLVLVLFQRFLNKNLILMELLKPQKLRIGLKAYEKKVLDVSCQSIIDAVNTSEVKTVGPVYLPTKRRIYCILRSPHVNKDAREHFEIRTHKRIIDIYSPSEQTMESLRNLDISVGVEIEIKNFS